jgi:ammonium transporter, Amt family
VKATSTQGVTGLFYGDGGQLIAQVFHVVIGFAWAWGVTWLIFTIAKNFMKIRVSPEVEIEGLDMPEFGVLAYPDFVLSHGTSGGHAVSSASSVPTPTPTERIPQ